MCCLGSALMESPHTRVSWADLGVEVEIEVEVEIAVEVEFGVEFRPSGQGVASHPSTGYGSSSLWPDEARQLVLAQARHRAHPHTQSPPLESHILNRTVTMSATAHLYSLRR